MNLFARKVFMMGFMLSRGELCLVAQLARNDSGGVEIVQLKEPLDSVF